MTFLEQCARRHKDQMVDVNGKAYEIPTDPLQPWPAGALDKLAQVLYP